MNPSQKTVIIHSGRYTYLAGVQWDFAETKKEAKLKAKSEKRKTKTIQHIVPNNDNSWLIGFYEASSKANFLAAPIVARMMGTGLVFYKIDEHQFWVLACHGGSVIPFRDLIVNESELESTLSAWSSDLQTENIMQFEDSDWAKVDDFRKGIVRSEMTYFTIRRPIQIKNALLVSAVGISLAIGSLFVYHYVEGWLKHNEQDSFELEERKKDLQARLVEQSGFRDEFNRAIGQKTKYHLSFNAGDQIYGLLQALENIDSPYPYSALNTIVCKPKNLTLWSCLPTWAPDAGLGLLAKAHVSPATPIDQIIDGQELQPGAEIQFAIEQTARPIYPGLAALQRPADLWLRDDLLAAFKNKPLNAEWGNTQPVLHQDPRIEGLNQAVIGNRTNLIIKGDLQSIDLKSLVEWLRSYPSQLNEFEINLSGFLLNIDIHTSSPDESHASIQSQ